MLSSRVIKSYDPNGCDHYLVYFESDIAKLRLCGRFFSYLAPIVNGVIMLVNMRAFFLLVFLTVSHHFVFGQLEKKAHVILVSFDGFRFDYTDRFSTPHFKKMENTGTRAAGLIPTYPSKTFPNHYSIVTGLYPGNHGLVDNSFYDPERRTFYKMSDREMVEDEYYYGGKPIWRLAKDHGLRTAAFFWVGSEVTRPEQRPDYMYEYDESVADTARINQVIRWLQLPEESRPRLITVYFSSPDHEGHDYGPHSLENKQAVIRSDSLLGALMDQLKAVDLNVNVVVVSDHGMSELKRNQDTYIFLPEIIAPGSPGIHVSNSGTQAHLYLDDPQETDSLYRALKKVAKKFIVYKPAEFPERWHYRHPRSGDLLIVARPGYYIVDQERKKYLKSIQAGSTFGTHGYDPADEPDMMGIFFASGPNIAAGKTIPAFLNIHIYPLLARLLGLPLPKIDGDPKVLESIIR